MDGISSQITSLTIFYSTVYSDADQRKHQSSASLAFVRGIHRGPVNSPHKWPVRRKMLPFDDVIMNLNGIVLKRCCCRFLWTLHCGSCCYCDYTMIWVVIVSRFAGEAERNTERCDLTPQLNSRQSGLSFCEWCVWFHCALLHICV